MVAGKVLHNSSRAMTQTRRESDLLGSRDLPCHALYGIHTARAIENFPLTGRPVRRELVHAFGAVKLAAAITNRELGMLDDAKFSAIEAACREMIEGRLDEHVVADALQGGAGTSTNMNVNEVLANRALQLLGRQPGDYKTISPYDLNRHQSTNDSFPTALKVAALRSLDRLEKRVVALLEDFQRKERELAGVVKIGRTQMQDAVLTTLGREMAAYAEAISRDRWRVHKCQERLRVVNFGGTAIGTGVGSPRRYMFRAVEHLRQITGLGLARAEDLVDATQNCDCFVEVSGILRTLATNLRKIASDLRFLSSGPSAGIAEIRLPPRQAGSSIMPGKVNPVIPEAVTQIAFAVAGYDQMIHEAAGAGNLELNPFLPLIAEALLTSIDLLANGCDVFARLCVAGIEANEAQCRRYLNANTAAITALVGTFGYQEAERLAKIAEAEGKPIRQVVVEQAKLSAAEFDALFTSDLVTEFGAAALDSDTASDGGSP